MDISNVLIAIITTVGTILCSYLAIVPQIRKNQIKTEDIENAIDNSKSLKAIKAGLVSEMRKSLISEYWEYSNRGFDMTPGEIENWNDDVHKYKELGGNGIITEFDNSIQVSLLERDRAKNSQRVIKL